MKSIMPLFMTAIGVALIIASAKVTGAVLLIGAVFIILKIYRRDKNE